MYKKNVIDLDSFRQKKAHKKKRLSKPTASTQTSSLEDAIDMTARRQSRLQEERRRVKRTILTEFISTYIVVPQRGLQRVDLYDISKDGLSFDLELEQGELSVNEEVAMRVYLSHQTYFPFFVKVSHLRTMKQEGFHRVGANFVKDAFNNAALGYFVKFLETVSASLKSDAGDVLVTNLKK